MTIQEHVYNVVKIFTDGHFSLKERLSKLIDYISGQFSIKRCSLMLIDSNGINIEVAASTNPNIIGIMRRTSDVCISTIALVEKKPLWIDKEARTFFRTLDKSKYESTSSLTIPLMFEEKRIGVINLTDFGDIEGFLKNHMVIIEEISPIVAAFIHSYSAIVSCQELKEKLDNKEGQLLEIDKLKTDLINFIVHDLKTPISVIIANLDMLNYENLTDSQSELVNLCIDEAENLKRMVLNILDIQKLEEARISILREEVDIFELLKNQIRSLGGLLKRRRITVELNGEPTTCYIDENLIGRTITNILINAIEHSPEDSRIKVTLQHNKYENSIVLKFEDEGGGIKEDMLDKIFDKYSQVLDDVKTYIKTSTGLGLTFCRLVVEAHGGRIWAENTNKGALFTVVLPQDFKKIIPDLG
ncbi:MAG: ATP-binding protein [Thermodesulfovibrionales bacterium]|nr:ATP-binding protein [Thermodesulfovibrionales bacterium]